MKTLYQQLRSGARSLAGRLPKPGDGSPGEELLRIATAFLLVIRPNLGLEGRVAAVAALAISLVSRPDRYPNGLPPLDVALSLLAPGDSAALRARAAALAAKWQTVIVAFTGNAAGTATGGGNWNQTDPIDHEND